MEMSLKHSTLVLLTAAVLLVSGQEHVILDHEEKKVDVAIGSSLTMHCKLETGTYERFRMKWTFLPSSGSSPNSSQTIKEYTVSRSADPKSNGSTGETHVIANVTDKDRGWYQCAVTEEIPGYQTDQSSKTQVVITESLMETTAQPSLVTRKQVTPNLVRENPLLMEWWMWMVLGFLILILFLLLLIICAVLRRRCHGRREDPIYANTRPVAKQPSPRPGQSANPNNLNTLKIVSSSGNLRPPSPSRKSYDNQRYRT